MARDDLQALRIAVYEGDHRSLVRILGGGVRSDVLQLVGDALAAAASVGVAGAEELARAWATPCGSGAGPATKSWRPNSTRPWGDAPPRRVGPCPSTWMSCRSLLEASLGEEGGRIDLETGEVWPASTIEYFAEQEPEQAPDFEDPDRWLYVGPEGSDEGYRDMEDFIGRVDNPDRAGPLGVAIDGRGAFRRFKDSISRWPDDQERWYRFCDERRRGRARQWLSFAGYRVASRGPETAT